MIWPGIHELSAMVPLPGSYRYELLNRADIPAVIAAIKVWYPEVAVGAASCYLREDFYSDKVFLDGETEKDIFVFLIKRNDELAAIWSMEWEPYALTLYAKFGTVSPGHRGAKLSEYALALIEKTGRAMGAGFVYGITTLKIPNMQLAFEHAGFQVIGFTPGYDREVVSPGVVKRVYEVVYAKVLVPEGDLLRPDTANMTPQVKALFELMFPR
ncbi:MAG: hypothetical protein Q7U91_04985 [Sideroxyarcus sp.]|nr:hypothetical protein [Sideroxyarcus sp.]